MPANATINSFLLSCLKMIAMRKILPLALVCCLVASCHKDDVKGPANTSAICFNTDFINTGLSSSFLSVFFINGKDGFVGTEDGGIYKTTDSARTWSSLHPPIGLPIRALYFIDENTGFAAGGENVCSGTGCIPGGGFILKTENGGVTWAKIFTPSTKTEINDICFINPANGFCVGGNTVYKTIDGGATWTENNVGNIGGLLMNISFKDNKTGFIVGLFNKLLKTEDGGATWQLNKLNNDVGYYAISSSNGGDYISGQGKILKSTNGGTSWFELTNSPIDIFDIKFIDKNTGYAFGRGNYSGGDFGRVYGAMYCTSNGGASWNGNGDFNEAGEITAVSFPAKNIGYAITGNKIIKIDVQ